MSDQYGPTTRVVTQDGTASGESSPMPLGPGAVLAHDGHVKLATDLREQQEEARRQEERTRATSKVDQGVHRFTEHADGRVEQSREGIVRSDSAPALTGSVLDGARSQSGMPQMQSEVTGESLVNYGGMEVRVSTLEQLGEVRKTANGYEPTRNFDQAPSTSTPPPTEPSIAADNVTDTTEEPPAEQFPDTPEGRRGAAEAITDALKVDGETAGSLFEDAVTLWEDGPPTLLDPESNPRVAELLGKNSSDVLASLQTYHAKVASEVAARHGVTDMEGFVEFIQSKGKMREAITRAVLENDPAAAWGGLAREFSATAENKHTDADILGADLGDDVKAFTGPDGRAWIEIDGEQLPWQEAHRRGLIRFV